MHRNLRALVAASLIFAAFAAPHKALSQDPAAQTVEDALHGMSDAAGVIFTGTVTAVRRSAASGVVEVDFAVADAVRGVAGPSYTLREWAGLWAANDLPFLPGQRYLMLLHTPNAAGLSSPVAGGDGAIPIRGSAPAAAPDSDAASSALASAQVISASSSAPPDPVLDLGWVATHVVRPLAYASQAPSSGSTGQAPVARPVGISARAVAGPAAPAAAGTGNATALSSAGSRSAPYSAVLSLLRSWKAPAPEAMHVASR